MLNEVGAIERHLEEEPQRRDGGIDLGCARPARRQMQAIAPYVLRLGRVRRAFKERGEVLDPLHVVMLGLRCERASRWTNIGYKARASDERATYRKVHIHQGCEA